MLFISYLYCAVHRVETAGKQDISTKVPKYCNFSARKYYSSFGLSDEHVVFSYVWKNQFQLYGAKRSLAFHKESSSLAFIYKKTISPNMGRPLTKKKSISSLLFQFLKINDIGPNNRQLYAKGKQRNFKTNMIMKIFWCLFIEQCTCLLWLYKNAVLFSNCFQN